jgi:hypothetical protein
MCGDVPALIVFSKYDFKHQARSGVPILKSAAYKVALFHPQFNISSRKLHTYYSRYNLFLLKTAVPPEDSR